MTRPRGLLTRAFQCGPNARQAGQHSGWHHVGRASPAGSTDPDHDRPRDRWLEAVQVVSLGPFGCPGWLIMAAEACERRPSSEEGV